MQERIINDLFSETQGLPYENSGMASVPKMKGKGFFPGCSGLSTDFTPDFMTPVMILGQDFGTKAYYASLDDEEGEYRTSPTFRQVSILLSDLGIRVEDCFFTNLFPGLRESDKMMGPCQPANAPESLFADASRNHLLHQLEAVRPRLVLVLGTCPARTLATWWPEDFIAWRNLEGVTKPIAMNRFYNYGANLFHDMRVGNEDIRFLFALHPSMSNTHRGLIWGRGGRGREQEVALMNAALPRLI